MLGDFVQTNNELVIQVFFLQICYLTCSKTEKFLMLLSNKNIKKLSHTCEGKTTILAIKLKNGFQ